MKKVKGRMDESILVCIYYGPNGERLIKRGHKLASMLDCPLYVLTVDALSYDEFDAEKADYINEWKQLCEELEVESFMLRDNEKRSSAKVIAEVVNKFNITQVIVGQTPQSRWEEITKGSFINVLLREMTFIDIHIVSCDRSIKSTADAAFEKGIRCYLLVDESGNGYRLCYACPKKMLHEGIFYKEIGTDFNTGIFKFAHEGITYQIHVTDNKITEPDKIPNSNTKTIEFTKE